MPKDNITELNQGTCKNCGQTMMINTVREQFPDYTNPDDLASMACECEVGKKWRKEKEQEAANTRFIKFIENDALAFMQKNELKRISIQDTNGNGAVLHLFENGDIKASTTLKKVF